MTATDSFLSSPSAGGEPPLVALRDVHLSFGSNDVLRGVNLEVRRGQAVSIIGPSGSGKSTILRCITGLLRPQRGEIRVGTTRVDGLRTEAELITLRKRVGFVFQHRQMGKQVVLLEHKAHALAQCDEFCFCA